MEPYRHVVNDPVVLVVHAHALLEEVQLGEVLGLVDVIALGANLVAGSGALVEEDLKKHINPFKQIMNLM